MIVSEALKEYIVRLSMNQAKAHKTVISYQDDLEQYVTWLQEQQIDTMENITAQLIQDFLILQQQTKADSSVVRLASSIRGFHHDYSFMHDTYDPSLNIEVRNRAKVLPVFCSIEEISRLMNSFDDTDPVQYTNHAILELIYACGLRVSEAVTMTLNRVDLEAGKLRVLGKGDKERIVPIPHECLKFFRYYRDVIRNGFLKQKTNLFFINRFGKKITTKHVELLLQNKCMELHIQKHITPHKLRHSYATHMLQGGADLRSIQEILGHANIETTEIYTHVQNKQMFDAYHKYNDDAQYEALNLPSKK